MKIKNNRTFILPQIFGAGFTLVELITVIVIITLLLGVLMPALSEVKKLAGQTKQKAQIASIEMGLNLYKNDFGEYPPSHGSNETADTYQYSYNGAQTLAEAMFGQDLLGFNPDSNYTNEGADNTIPLTAAARHYAFNTMTPTERDASLSKRKGSYLDRTNIGVFTPKDIFGRDTYLSPGNVVKDRQVICDVFTTVSRNIDLGGGVIKTFKIGTPVLYFRANSSALNTELKNLFATDLENNIYNYLDNVCFLKLGKVTDKKIEHPLCPFISNPTSTADGRSFLTYIRDPMIPISDSSITTIIGTPVRPDSFILISAGYDGIYGTKDDICNFNPNLP